MHLKRQDRSSRIYLGRLKRRSVREIRGQKDRSSREIRRNRRLGSRGELK